VATRSSTTRSSAASSKRSGSQAASASSGRGNKRAASASSRRNNKQAASTTSRRKSKQASTTARKRTGTSSAATRAFGPSARSEASGAPPRRASRKPHVGPVTITKERVGGLAGALAGAAAVGVAVRAAVKQRAPRGQVLGTSIPPQLNTEKLDPRSIAQNVDLKKVLKRIGDVAEQVEARSEDVRMLSAQARRLSRKLG
jgi:hypothetical protein